MGPEPKFKEFDNVEEVVHHYFSKFELHEADIDEKSPSEEGVELADEVIGNLEIKLRELENSN